MTQFIRCRTARCDDAIRRQARPRRSFIEDSAAGATCHSRVRAAAARVPFSALFSAFFIQMPARFSSNNLRSRGCRGESCSESGGTSEWSINIPPCSVRSQFATTSPFLWRKRLIKAQDEIDTIVDEKLELVGMKDSRNLMPSELSGGMRKTG